MVEAYVYKYASVPAVEVKFHGGMRSRLGQDDLGNIKLICEVFKQSPVSMRSYNSLTRVWTFDAGVWPSIDKTLKAFHIPLNILDSTRFSSLEDYEDYITYGAANKSKHEPVPSVEEFFHAPAAPTTKLSRPVAEVLQVLLNTMALPEERAALRKLYLQAAKRLHPDHNNGIDAGLTELNVAYQEYVAQKGWN